MSDTGDLPRPLLVTGKLAQPSLPPSVQLRRRLLALLDEPTPVTVVTAGAGWGKSTLLASWAASTRAVADVAWLSLDPADDEPLRFWSYVAAALEPWVPEAAARALAALAVPSVDPVDVAVPELLNGLGALRRPVVLVLDDVHVLSDVGVVAGLELFADYLPPGVRLVLAGRSAPPLPLARLRARGRLSELGAADLRFSDADGARLLTAVARTVPDAVTLSRLVRRAEGWAAGLVLAGLVLRQARPDDEAGNLVAPADAETEYLVAEVLAGQPPERRAFLLDSAALPTMSGLLCDAVLQREGSARVLADLDRDGLFTTALTPDRDWYRYHPLFRRALLKELADPGRVAVLQRRAAEWHRRHGRAEDAVRALIEAGDHEAAGRLLLDSTTSFLAGGGVGVYSRLGDAVGEDVAAHVPGLALSLAWAAGSTGARDRVPRLLDLAEACLASGGDDGGPPGFRSARGLAAALRSVYDPQRTSDEVLTDARAATRLETDPTLPGWVVARVAYGGALLSHDRAGQALGPLREAWACPATVALPAVSRLEVAGLLAWALVRAGQPTVELRRLLSVTDHEAREVEAALGEAAAEGLALRCAASGLQDLADGRPAAGLAALRLAGQRVLVRAHPGVAMLVLTALAEAELQHGEPRAARAALEQARAAGTDFPAPVAATQRLAVLEARAGRRAMARARPVLVEPLTDRELEVLRALRGTLSQREIGRELHLSVNTVKGYAKSLYRKLDVVSRSEAVSVGRELGLC